MDKGCWKIEGDEALLACGPLAARVTLSHVQLGLHALSWRGAALPNCSALGFRAAAAHDSQFAVPIESYVRGRDLVATFACTGSLNAAPQLYWRVAEHPDSAAVAVELILSVHTDLLDSQPECCVRSFMADAGIRQCGERALPTICDHLIAPQISYAELIHPDDFNALAVLDSKDRGGVDLQSRLFPERLEKGVIRRARVCGWFLPAENDVEVVGKLAQKFLDEPLPLTT